MPPARAEDADVLSKILEESRVGRFTVPMANLQHTSIGRPLHTSGIDSILESIETQGWLGSKMTVSLVGSIPDGELTDDAATGQQYRLIDGNHRLAVLRQLQAKNQAADPPRASFDAIEVEVHAGLTLEKERLIASSLNVTTELVVKTTLSDRVGWYKAWSDDMQSKHKGKTSLSANAVSTRFVAESKKPCSMFDVAGLTFEESPVVSLYLHGKSGRPAQKRKFVYPSQGSVTLLAHKSATFICNGGGPRSGAETSSRTRGAAVEPPRTMELDGIGAVVSLAHPPTVTFLPRSTADLLIKRCSDVGDSVLVSGGIRDVSLASAAVLEGRVAIVLEPEASKLASTAARLETLSSDAAKEGMWARMLRVSQPMVTVGPNQLPSMVPASNIPASTAVDLDLFRDSRPEDPERAVADKTAALHGLRIQGEGAACGLFAGKRLEDTPGVFLKMPVVGNFEVHDSEEDAAEASEKDGLPRFLVSSNINMFLSDFEVARPKAGLYLVPASTDPLFYMRWSGIGANHKNAQRYNVLTARGLRAWDDKGACLRNASNSVVLVVQSVGA